MLSLVWFEFPLSMTYGDVIDDILSMQILFAVRMFVNVATRGLTTIQCLWNN